MAFLLVAYIACACWNEHCVFELTGKQSSKNSTAFQYQGTRKHCKIRKCNGNEVIWCPVFGFINFFNSSSLFLYLKENCTVIYPESKVWGGDLINFDK